MKRPARLPNASDARARWSWNGPSRVGEPTCGCRGPRHRGPRSNRRNRTHGVVVVERRASQTFASREESEERIAAAIAGKHHVLPAANVSLERALSILLWLIHLATQQTRSRGACRSRREASRSTMPHVVRRIASAASSRPSAVASGNRTFTREQRRQEMKRASSRDEARCCSKYGSETISCAEVRRRAPLRQRCRSSHRRRASCRRPPLRDSISRRSRACSR